jgi:hypothetical protein
MAPSTEAHACQTKGLRKALRARRQMRQPSLIDSPPQLGTRRSNQASGAPRRLAPDFIAMCRISTAARQRYLHGQQCLVQLLWPAQRLGQQAGAAALPTGTDSAVLHRAPRAGCGLPTGRRMHAISRRHAVQPTLMLLRAHVPQRQPCLLLPPITFKSPTRLQGQTSTHTLVSACGNMV